MAKKPAKSYRKLVSARSSESVAQVKRPSVFARIRQGTPVSEVGGWRWGAYFGLTLGLALWLFWPTLLQLVQVWENEPDYSHGFLVVPFSLMIAWWRRDLFPVESKTPGWGGLLLLVVSIVVAYVGARLFLVPLAGWTMIVWLCGACWLLLGNRGFYWALPALLFLFFMVPLPFRVEQLMSWRLQLIATEISSWMLQILGQPAVASANIVYLGDQVLEVEQACSGLRMFVGISAVAYMFVVLTRRAWWERVAVVLAVAPIAIVANSIRVAVTGLLLQAVSSEAAKTFTHDVAGWAMVLVATLLFGAFVAFLRLLVVEVELDSGKEVLGRSAVSRV
jgi:exosortase